MWSDRTRFLSVVCISKTGIQTVPAVRFYHTGHWRSTPTITDGDSIKFCLFDSSTVLSSDVFTQFGSIRVSLLVRTRPCSHDFSSSISVTSFSCLITEQKFEICHILTVCILTSRAVILCILPATFKQIWTCIKNHVVLGCFKLS